MKSSERRGSIFFSASQHSCQARAGKATSHEGFDQGMVDGFLVTFKSEEDHNFYIDADPVHKEFQRFVSPKLDQDGVFVFDFMVERSAPKP